MAKASGSPAPKKPGARKVRHVRIHGTANGGVVVKHKLTPQMVRRPGEPRAYPMHDAKDTQEHAFESSDKAGGHISDLMGRLDPNGDSEIY